MPKFHGIISKFQVRIKILLASNCRVGHSVLFGPGASNVDQKIVMDEKVV